VTLALNLHTQGVDPGLDLSQIDTLVGVVEYCNRLPVHPRHPYAGELVYTAFSGSHQDAIKKGFAALREADGDTWEVPYLPIDPSDVGRSYETVIRINSQSGKGGVAYVLEADHGLRLPRGLQIEFGRAVQAVTDASEEEVSSKTLLDLFEREYQRRGERFELVDHAESPLAGGRQEVRAKLRVDGKQRRVRGEGTGPIDAFVAALRNGCDVDVHVLDYSEHAIGDGEDAAAIAYVQVRDAEGRSTWGVGRQRSIVGASLDAVIGAVNRLLAIAGGQSR
jgi:2-isopropylmalate synthase